MRRSPGPDTSDAETGFRRPLARAVEFLWDRWLMLGKLNTFARVGIDAVPVEAEASYHLPLQPARPCGWRRKRK